MKCESISSQLDEKEKLNPENAIQNEQRLILPSFGWRVNIVSRNG